VLDRAGSRAEPAADDHAGATADADWTAGEHTWTDSAAESAASGNGAMRARCDEQRSAHDDAGDAKQHDVGSGADVGAGDARSAGELAGSKHGAGAKHRQPAVVDRVDAAAGIVARVARADHRR
jgi:hypothetical protein